jgi:4-hydroxy-3-methylbut-2-enyl diphosphate reductase
LQKLEKENFAEMFESLQSFKRGEHVKAVVEKITLDEVLVRVNNDQIGSIPVSEISDQADINPKDFLGLGEEIDVLVLKISEKQGTLVLSKKRYDRIKDWDEVLDAYKKGTILKAKVIETRNTGIVALYKTIRVFIPMSQVVNLPGNMEASENLLNQIVSFKVIKTEEMRKKAIGSIRAFVTERKKELKKRFWEEAKTGKHCVGNHYDGIVKNIEEYGVFVDIGGADGMIHVAELSWNRVDHPSDILKVGDKVDVFIKKIDSETEKISLGYKKEEDSPWEKFKRKFKPGDIVTSKIVSFMKFGAFATIEDTKIDGLIHISQIADYHVNAPQDVLEMGQSVQTLIRDIDPKRKCVGLSITAAEKKKKTLAKDQFLKKSDE